MKYAALTAGMKDKRLLTLRLKGVTWRSSWVAMVLFYMLPASVQWPMSQ